MKSPENDGKEEHSAISESPSNAEATEEDAEELRLAEIQREQELLTARSALIIQRYLRGFLARKAYKELKTKATFDSIQKQALENGPKLTHVRFAPLRQILAFFPFPSARALIFNCHISRSEFA